MYEIIELISKISNFEKYLELKNEDIGAMLISVRQSVLDYKDEYLLDNNVNINKDLLIFKLNDDLNVTFYSLLENIYRPIMTKNEYEKYLLLKKELKEKIDKSATVEMRIDVFIKRLDNALDFLYANSEENKMYYLRLFELRSVFSTKTVIDYIDNKNNAMISFFRNDNKDEIYCLRRFFSEFFLVQDSFNKSSLKDNKFIKMFNSHELFKKVTHTNRYTAFKSNNSAGIFVLNEKKDDKLKLIDFKVNNREISSGAAAQKGIFNVLNKILELDNEELAYSKYEECINFIEIFFEEDALQEISAIFKYYLKSIYDKALKEEVDYNTDINFKEITLPFNNTYKRLKILSKSNIENTVSKHISALRNAKFELSVKDDKKDARKNIYKDLINEESGLIFGEKRVGTLFYKDDNASLNFGMSRKYFNLIKNREITFREYNIQLNFTIKDDLLYLENKELERFNFIVKRNKYELVKKSDNNIVKIIENLYISNDFYDQKINRTIAIGYLTKIIENVLNEIEFDNITVNNEIINYEKDIMLVQQLFLFLKKIFSKGLNLNKNLSNSLDEIIYTNIRNRGEK